MQTSSQEDQKYSDDRNFDNQKVPPDITTLVEPTPQYQRPDDTVIARNEANNKSFVYQTSFDEQRYHELHGTLMQYVSGTPIRVTYYKQLLPDDRERTSFGDTDFIEHDSHIDLEQIINFEFRTESQFNFSWDSEKGIANFSGEGITYPGFEPTIGDLFVYKIHDAIGLFVITHIEPLSLRQGSYHRINFILRSRLNADDRKILESRTRSSSVFDIQKCLGEKLTLLKHSSYITLEKLREIRKSLSIYYNHIFYNELVESYLRPDGIYDPYVVKFMLKKNDTFVIKKRPMQLVIVDDYLDTIWSIFTDLKHSDIQSLKKFCTTSKKIDGIFGTQFNGLTNKEYVVLLNDSDILIENNSNINKNNANNRTKVYAINEPDPIFKAQQNCDIDEEELCDPNDDHTHYHIYYYKPNIHHNHHHTFFKQPPCSTIPPCIKKPMLPENDNDNDNTNLTKIDGYYIFDSVFYNGLSNQMTEIEKIIYEYITSSTIDAKQVSICVSNFRKLSKDKLFYYGPLYLGIIDVAIKSIT